MKKLFVTILVFFYLGVSSRAVLHFHYCMDKLVYWGLENKNGSKCSKCGMKPDASKKGCCKDEAKQLKLQEAHKTADFSFKLTTPFSPALTPTNHSFVAEPVVLLAVEYPVSHGPPGLPAVSVYLRNCVFLI